MEKISELLTPNTTYRSKPDEVCEIIKVIDPLEALEAYRNNKDLSLVQKPYGIDKDEAIKVMSQYGKQDLKAEKRSEDQLFRLIESQVTIAMADQKRKREAERSSARARGLPGDPTTSESETEIAKKKQGE